MHIPDGFLSTPVWAGMNVVSAGAVGLAVRRLNRTLDVERVPLMGMTGAFIFAAQMVNFPVAGGTSGHLLGGFLAALLLGPAAAVVVMTTVFAVQCLLFQDGGLLALGANVFNMGILGSVGGYGVYRLLLGLSPRAERRTGLGLGLRTEPPDPNAGYPLGGRTPNAERRTPIHHSPAIAIGAWASVMLGAAATALELALSGTVSLRLVLPAMLGVHALIGVGEALVTLGALAVLAKARPGLVRG